jgi:iron complex outermembrane receptor protein
MLAAILVCPTAEALTRITFQILPEGFAEQYTVELVSPSGETQVEESSDDFFVVDVSTSGSYRLSITAGDVSESADIDVPYSGQLNVTFRADAPADRITVAQGTEIENITVTARRVAEPLQKAPVAITALSESQIDDQNIVNIQKLAIATPNLWMEKNTSSSSGARAAIRGIGEDESFFTSDTPVGIYIDDIYIPRQIGAMFDLYEVDRVEVLRGPQGTLYGRNTSAGAIKIITKQPGQDFALNLEGAVGNYNLVGLRGSVGVPVSDLFSFQVAAMYRVHDGYDENLYNGADVNDQDIWGVRASLRFTPSDSLDILAVGDMLIERSTPGYPLGLVPQPPFVGFYGVGLPNLDDQLDGDTDVHTLLSDLTEPLNDLDQSGLYAKVSWQASDSFTFNSITGWRDQDWLFLTDGDAQVGNRLLPGIIPEFLPLFHIFQDQQQEQWSQEFQGLGAIGNSVDYVAGLYFFHEENQQITENVILTPLGFNNYWDTSLTTDSYAVYGSFDFRLAENLTLTAGGRYTNDDKDFDTKVFHFDGSPLVACLGPDGSIVDPENPCDDTAPEGSVDAPVEKSIKESWDRFTPRLALSWAATDNVLAYLDLSTGFKSGAFDGRANEASNVLFMEAIPPEDIRSYEIGLKSDLLNRRWRLNVAAFFTDFNDLQGTGTDPDGNFVRISLGDVETSGGELETTIVAAPGLQFNANVGLLDTKYTDKNFDQALECGSLGTADAELELKYSPRTSYRVGALYSSPKTFGGGYWTFGANYSHKDEHFLGFCNSGAQTQVAYDLVDALIAYETRNYRWRFSVAGDNLTDEDYIGGLFAISGLNMLSTYIGAPRTYSFRVNYRF